MHCPHLGGHAASQRRDREVRAVRFTGPGSPRNHTIAVQRAVRRRGCRRGSLAGWLGRTALGKVVCLCHQGVGDVKLRLMLVLQTPDITPPLVISTQQSCAKPQQQHLMLWDSITAICNQCRPLLRAGLLKARASTTRLVQVADDAASSTKFRDAKQNSPLALVYPDHHSTRP